MTNDLGCFAAERFSKGYQKKKSVFLNKIRFLAHFLVGNTLINDAVTYFSPLFWEVESVPRNILFLCSRTTKTCTTFPICLKLFTVADPERSCPKTWTILPAQKMLLWLEKGLLYTPSRGLSSLPKYVWRANAGGSCPPAVLWNRPIHSGMKTFHLKWNLYMI